MRTLKCSAPGLFPNHPCLHPPDHIPLILPANPVKWDFSIDKARFDPQNAKNQVKFAIYLILAII